MRVLDLFSGIGGFSLGLERAGMTTVAFCEIEPYCRRVLAKHWPGVPCYGDIRELTAERLRADGISVDVICGGFPCQDASVGNTDGLGTDGDRTGLYAEAVRLAGELGVGLILENVTGLFERGFGDVLRALAEIRFDAEWAVISARDAGADHQRDRVWIVAHPSGAGRQGSKSYHGLLGRALSALAKHDNEAFGDWRSLVGGQSVLRGGDGLSVAMERRRLHALGNAVVPQIPEMIGRAIMETERGRTA
jgi:DNA (cytosine-5)-methyltransferase 1